MNGVLMVLLTVLKIAGILVAVIAALLLILILLILFAPVRYEVKGYKAGDDIDALAKVRWLTPLLRADVIYKKKPGDKEAIFDYWVKVFWIKVYPKDEKEEEVAKKPSKKKKKGGEPEDEETITDYSKWDLKEEKDELSEYLSRGEGSDETVKAGRKIEDGSGDYYEGKDEEPEKKKIPLKEKISSKINEIRKKLTEAKNKAASLKNDADARYKWVKERADFLSKEENRTAVGKILGELIKILIHCLPKKGKAVADLGFEDPGTTGKAVGAYAFLYPHIGRFVQLNADYEKSIMDAKGELKGRIIVFFLLCRGLTLVLDKNVRRFVRELQRYI